jgi:molybdopterin converting factor small subunit
MEYSVLLFASLKDAAMTDCIMVEVPSRSDATVTVAELLTHCGQQFPKFLPWLPHIRVAVNCEYANGLSLLHEGDEIALLPPVAGGYI